MIATRIADGPSVPVGKIVAVGRNYADHAREMGAERPDEPLLFLMPPTALHQGPGPLALPSFSHEVHHEVELVVRLAAGGSGLSLGQAADALDGWAVGIDLTARDLQRRAKQRGEPWSVAKGFDGAAPLAALRPLAAVDELADLPISLSVGGQVRQQDTTASMLWPVAELVAFVSTRFSWQPGDLLFTGTPAGVGPLRGGDHVEARVGPSHLDLRIA